jgi:ABC-type branched-subunit amino acid transport system ATPase component/branched-subunit amino acid ABC-type transport system permease component
MQDFLPFVIIGITTGAAYGLAGTGVVLTYKTSGIFNFAYGSLAALAVFVFYFLHTEHGMAWPLAALICLFVLAPLEGLALERLARALEPASATLKVAATVGLLLVVLGIGSIWYSNNTSNFPQFLPVSTISLDGVQVGWDQIIVVITSLVATTILYLFFRFFRLGIGMRGVVDNADLISLTGENPNRVRRWSWVIGTIFASAAGLLLAPNLNLNVLILTLLIVQAFGAAAIGYFSSLPLTFLGGIFIGICSAFADKYAASVSWLSGFPSGLPFIVLFIALLVTPKILLVDRRIVPSLPVQRSWQAPLRIRLAGTVLLLLALIFVPTFVGSQLSLWTNALIDIVLFLSLGLLVKNSGQISLCHYAFAAVGAAAFSHFTGSYHIPWLAAIIMASLVTVPVGAIVAIPAIRLSGVFLALATLGFGIFLEQVLYSTTFLFGPEAVGLGAPRPDVSLGSWHLYTDTGFYYVALIFAALIVGTIVIIQHGRLGRLMSGMADSPLALETHGTTTNVTRVMVFCISAALAGLAGALIAVLFHSSVAGNYPSFNSIIIVIVVIISVGGVPWYGILAAIGYTVIPGYVTITNINTYLEIVFGVAAVLFAVQGGKTPQIPLRVREFLDQVGGRIPGVLSPASESLLTTCTELTAHRSTPTTKLSHVSTSSPTIEEGIAVKDLGVQFGGIHAVHGVSLQAPMGRITGLIGPNGAGKTTLFNACCGLVKPSTGRVYFRGKDITELGSAHRSRLGLGRSFQRAQLFDSLTVRENLELGCEASMAGGNPLTQLMGTRKQRQSVTESVDRAIAITGIGPLCELQAGLLPVGQRRLVELARALAAPFDLLLLDEPSSGLDASETRKFGTVLTDAVAERQIGILLVEHDMDLVRQVCEGIYVLDFGELLFEGSAEEMLSSSVVRAAYLGSEGGDEPTFTLEPTSEVL